MTTMMFGLAPELGQRKHIHRPSNMHAPLTKEEDYHHGEAHPLASVRLGMVIRQTTNVEGHQ
jgi:hypothetical protein